MEQIRVCTHEGPGAQPVIRTVPWPKIGRKAALIKVGACGVCGTDLHILKGHWPAVAVAVYAGPRTRRRHRRMRCRFTEDFMSKPLAVDRR
jgi:NADPH:quinone reductase-like Zn-dependent oxidoreductase